MMRLMMIGRAVSPLPPMAPSTHLSPPRALKESANTFTAAASPPDVHQCVTSQSAACAAVNPPKTETAAAASSLVVYVITFLPFHGASVRRHATRRPTSIDRRLVNVYIHPIPSSGDVNSQSPVPGTGVLRSTSPAGTRKGRQRFLIAHPCRFRQGKTKS